MWDWSSIGRVRAHSPGCGAVTAVNRSPCGLFRGASIRGRRSTCGSKAPESVDTVRAEVLERAESSGLVDDERFAERRARQLAERGAGDLLIVDDLVRQGVDDAVARAAVRHLPVEADRAAAIVERRGRSARTLRYLASRGFSEDSLEPLIADIGSGALR